MMECTQEERTEGQQTQDHKMKSGYFTVITIVSYIYTGAETGDPWKGMGGMIRVFIVDG